MEIYFGYCWPRCNLIRMNQETLGQFFLYNVDREKKKKGCDQCFLECTWLSVSKGLNLIWFIFNLRLFLRINCLQKSFECKSLNSFDSWWILQHTQYINLLWGLLFFFPVIISKSVKYAKNCCIHRRFEHTARKYTLLVMLKAFS